MEGFLLIDKPAGMTSHDVVDRVRRVTNIRKVGHAGTLDPFATGLLIVGVGRPATREMQKIVGLDKTYETVFMFGAQSDTDDREGVIEPAPIDEVGDVEIKAVFESYTGAIKQLPPTYSAVKINGQKMYEAARKGQKLEAKPRSVTVYQMVPALPMCESRLAVTIECSSGTYIRALARDIGKDLGGGGYVEELRRTRIGSFSIEDATKLDDLTPENVEACLIRVQDLLDQLSKDL
jgi:tRNA pseudouridine55 synthase